VADPCPILRISMFSTESHFAPLDREGLHGAHIALVEFDQGSSLPVHCQAGAGEPFWWTGHSSKSSRGGIGDASH
jgi:hypothetical protein